MIERVSENNKLSNSGVLVEVDEDEGREVVLVPEMDEEELHNSVTSRGKRMVPIVPPVGLTAWEFQSLISATYLSFIRHGNLPTPEDLRSMLPGWRQNKIRDAMLTPGFRRAMLIRGIDFREQAVLNPEQDMAIAIMAAPDGKPFAQKLKAAGVPPSRWRAWLKQQKFREVWNSVGGSVLNDFEGDMLVALAGQALNGNVGAIQYALEVSGRHAPQQQKVIDTELLMKQFIQIVQEEVKDTEILGRIAARMQLTAGIGKGTPTTLIEG